MALNPVRSSSQRLANGDRTREVRIVSSRRARETELEVLYERIAALERDVAALLAAHPRDVEDERLRQQIAASSHGLAFRAKDLLEHSRFDPELAHALSAVCIQTAGELGSWLRQARGVRGGVAVERLRQRQWRVHIEHVT